MMLSPSGSFRVWMRGLTVKILLRAVVGMAVVSALKRAVDLV